MYTMDSFYKGCLMYIAAVLGLLGSLSMLVFLAGLLIRSQQSGYCCPTALGCYPCDNSPAPLYLPPLFIGAPLLAIGGALLYLAYKSKPY
jgi:hypothetical protein